MPRKKPMQQRAVRILLSRVLDWSRHRIKEAIKKHKDDTKPLERLLTATELKEYGLKVYAVTRFSNFETFQNSNFVVKTVRSQADFDAAIKNLAPKFPESVKQVETVDVELDQFGVNGFWHLSCLPEDLDVVEDAIALIEKSILADDAVETSAKLDLLLWKES